MISHLLEKDSVKRFSSDDALVHEWFKGEIADTPPIIMDEVKSKSIINNLCTYKNDNKLNKAIKMFNFKLASSNTEVQRLRDLFLQSDKNKNGVLERNEF